MEHSKAIPAFVEGNTVTGEVRLDLESDPIQTVVLSLKGQVITGVTPHEMYTFIDVPTTLWSRSMGDPRNPGSASNETKWTEKLRGQYVWPFSISVPPTVSLRDEVFRLPPTFFERHTRAQIEYEISVRFTRTKLRSDHKLSTIINYMPLSRPGPFSYLRQLAYQQNTAMLGPDSDPEGWETLPYVRTRGKLPGSTRSFEAKCRVRLSQCAGSDPLNRRNVALSCQTPLYTRGSVIPCALVVECGDPEGLELLSSPDVVVMRMRRSVRYHTGEKTAANFGDIPNKIVWKDELDHSELATWWPAADRALEVDSTDAIAVSAWKRMLKGEIHLRPDLITSSAIAHFRIEYSWCSFRLTL
ncbi:hypothetical protein B0H10DRAFT_760842 [Mycena sp. CBHHK59/15]|nr:hypothetical protein B0H10DRAFT_760842 [Mycena sp. CBHHK59/15]